MPLGLMSDRVNLSLAANGDDSNEAVASVGFGQAGPFPFPRHPPSFRLGLFRGGDARGWSVWGVWGDSSEVVRESWQRRGFNSNGQRTPNGLFSFADLWFLGALEHGAAPPVPRESNSRNCGARHNETAAEFVQETTVRHGVADSALDALPGDVFHGTTTVAPCVLAGGGMAGAGVGSLRSRLGAIGRQPRSCRRPSERLAHPA